jgi:SET domain-containing protein
MTLNHNTAPEEDVEVRPSQIHGMGLFARRVFEPGEIVLRWDLSRLIAKEDFALLSPAEQHYTHPFDEERLILVQPPERFVNHSCNNNTEVRNFCDVAMRRISPGDEITSSYWSDGSGSRFVCSCGSENCSRKIDSKV